MLNSRFLAAAKCTVLLWLAAISGPAITAEDPNQILISAGGVVVTTSDMNRYLDYVAVSSGRALEDLSSQRVSQAVIELYALAVLDHEARKSAILTGEEGEWVANHLLINERAMRVIALKLDRMMAATDWDAEAREYYLVNKSEFMTTTTLTVRTMLIKTDDRSEAEAIELAEALVSDDMSLAQFESVVTKYTEDEVAKKQGGLMADLTTGQTVQPFEEAAFALSEVGEISDPVPSVFGVHVIQLLDRQEPRQQQFEEVKSQIIESLRPIRIQQYAENIRQAARTYEPDDYVIDEEAIRQYMAGLGFEEKTLPSVPGVAPK